ncbi:MAG: rRNA pseudouridine synthase [Clostridia bacterium]|nr:rRNA pseudouridine synthase [Clostridia bacterium]
MEEIRLQKYLVMCSVASRRGAEQMITEGRVSVNGTVVTELGTKVTQEDIVCADGKRVRADSKKIYIMLNKPKGYVSTARDDRGRRTVMDLVSDIPQRIYPVGRLDYDTEGLIFMTNDGDMTYSLTHPKYEKNKVYEVLVSGIMLHGAADKLAKGVYIDGKKTHPAEVEVTEHRRNSSVVRISIHEGRNRQIRKMCDAVGHPVLSLKRVAVDGIELGNLPEGRWRYLTSTEVMMLKKLSH